MLDRGLIEETRALLQSGVPENAKPFGAIGYKQALSVLRGEMSVERALEEMQRDTRRYAKRQWTWFRRDKRVNWVTGFGDDVNTHQKVVELLHKALFWY
jgi:tRNA dimethylallyltransferase